MKAIVHNTYGDADVLHIDDVPDPTVKPHQVLVRVRAADVDRGVWHAMTGLPLVSRLGFGLRRPRNRTPGLDLAGVVEQVGDQVTDFKVGDEVFREGSSSWAEYTCAKAARLLHKPAHLSFEEAAVLPTSGATALHMLGGDRTRGDVLVIGAGGGVGSFTVLLAKARGDRVTAVCSAAKADAVRRFGADHVIDYTKEQLTGTYDLIVDIAGNRPLSVLRAPAQADRHPVDSRRRERRPLLRRPRTQLARPHHHPVPQADPARPHRHRPASRPGRPHLDRLPVGTQLPLGRSPRSHEPPGHRPGGRQARPGPLTHQLVAPPGRTTQRL